MRTPKYSRNKAIRVSSNVGCSGQYSVSSECMFWTIFSVYGHRRGTVSLSSTSSIIIVFLVFRYSFLAHGTKPHLWYPRIKRRLCNKRKGSVEKQIELYFIGTMETGYLRHYVDARTMRMRELCAWEVYANAKTALPT